MIIHNSFCRRDLQAVVSIPFTLHQNALILVSVSLSAGHSCSEFARPATRATDKPWLVSGTQAVFSNNGLLSPKRSPTQWGSGETRHACRAIIYDMYNFQNNDAALTEIQFNIRILPNRRGLNGRPRHWHYRERRGYRNLFFALIRRSR